MGELGNAVILKALQELGRQLGVGAKIEIVLVGGSAAVLAGLLPPSVTTADVDAIHFRPSGDVDVVLQAADAVADALNLEKGWFNTDAGLYASAIPDGWETRRRNFGAFGRLHVSLVSRADWIVMKFFAHREEDLEHLMAVHVSDEELDFAEKSLDRLLQSSPGDLSKIQMALYVVRHWKTKDD